LTWGAILLGLASVALSLPRFRVHLLTWSWRNLVAFVAALPIYGLIAAGAVMLIMSLSVRPILADALFKLASPYDQQGSWENAVSLHEQAVAQNPDEDFYYLWLGYARLGQANQEKDPARRETLAAQALEALERARALSPLNPDHTANLARYHRAVIQIQTDAAAQETSARAASSFYAQAVVLAPGNVVLWNEWAMLQRDVLRDNTEACRLLQHSLELDPTFEQTRMLAENCR
jgi:tetratricopeptide (TPR) repeat protein